MAVELGGPRLLLPSPNLEEMLLAGLRPNAMLNGENMIAAASRNLQPQASLRTIATDPRIYSNA